MSTRINSETQAYAIAQRGGYGAVTAVSRVSQVAWFTNHDEAMAFARDWFKADDGAHAVELTDYYTGEVIKTIDYFITTPETTFGELFNM